MFINRNRERGIGSQTKDTAAVMGRLVRDLDRLRDDRSGNIAMIFAALLVPIAGMIGMSLDYANALNTRTHIQGALDSAALAGGREYQLTNDVAAAQAKAEQIFAELTKDYPDISLAANAVDSDEGKIDLTALGTVDTKFLTVLGVDQMNVGVETTATLANGGLDKDLEVSLMLDVTGSMGGSKIDDLKEAAKDLVNILVRDDQSEHASRIALVPFSETVRPPSSMLAAVRGTPPGTVEMEDAWGNDRTFYLSSCVSERHGSHAYTDQTPVPGHYVGSAYTFNGSCRPGNEIVPLTSDKDLLKQTIDAFGAEGWTSGHLGTAWAWYTLSPNWGSVMPAGSVPGSYNPDDRMKVAVLMTDGEFNTQYHQGVQDRYTDGTAENGSSNDQARALCDAMKAEEIVIYTVGFALTDQSAIDTMEYCASADGQAMLAADGAELKQAFRSIAFQIAQLRLSQ